MTQGLGPESAILPSSAVTSPSASAAPATDPRVPTRPSRKAPVRPSVGWVLGAAGLGAIALVAVVVGLSIRSGSSARGRGPSTPAIGAPAKSFPHVSLSQLTTEMIIARAEDAGYEIVSNQSRDIEQLRWYTVTVKRSSRYGTIIMYAYRDVERARATAEAFKKNDDMAVLQEGARVLLVQMANGAERGNRMSRELLRAIMR
jgi:hypothetical protein